MSTSQALERAAAAADEPSAVMERVITAGDLQKLTPRDRTLYYDAVCRSVGLNPLTRPFEYITLNNKLTLYARKDCTDQLRRINGVSVQIVSREQVGDVYVVTARATDGHGRADESIGAVSVKGLNGDNLCNALMKAETKAKRRVTLSVCGLGFLDETERETIPGAAKAPPAVIIPAEGDESLSLEQETELLRQAVRDLCANLNAEGYQPKWSAVTLKTYVNDKYMVAGGLDALDAAQLRELANDLEGKLEALKPPTADGEEVAF